MRKAQSGSRGQHQQSYDGPATFGGRFVAASSNSSSASGSNIIATNPDSNKKSNNSTGCVLLAGSAEAPRRPRWDKALPAGAPGRGVGVGGGGAKTPGITALGKKKLVWSGSGGGAKKRPLWPSTAAAPGADMVAGDVDGAGGGDGATAGPRDRQQEEVGWKMEHRILFLSIGRSVAFFFIRRLVVFIFINYMLRF